MSYQARHMRGSEAKTGEAPAAQQVVPAEDSADNFLLNVTLFYLPL